MIQGQDSVLIHKEWGFAPKFTLVSHQRKLFFIIILKQELQNTLTKDQGLLKNNLMSHCVYIC